jgi:5-(carboxyamino)imidazole ribonucleotide synthase
VRNAEELPQAVGELGVPSILKTADFGYDGKGQVRIDRDDSVETAWSKMGRPLGVLEAFVPFTQEISVICARSCQGNVVCFGPAENVHVRHILDVTTVPANVPPKVITAAIDLAQAICESLNVVGLLTVEMFVVGDKILVNELAPRPHNSGHYSFDACVTSQFEQQLRAVCGLPLGDVQLLKPAAMANLLGDIWQNGEPRWERALDYPEVKLHLYGKRDPRPGRKMGHLTALANTPQDAKTTVLAARATL